MTFTCVSCSEVYFEVDGLPGELDVTGLCEPCGRRRLGARRYDEALERASRGRGHP